MKPLLRRLIISIVILNVITIIFLTCKDSDSKSYKSYITQNMANNFTSAYIDVNEYNIEKEKEEQRKKALVYEDMTMSELTNLINKSLNSTLSGKGELIASQSLKKGVDPITATAIILQETGCKWTCSQMVRQCNNVGGVKGSPNCGGGYKKYSTLDEGIKSFINNLADNYYAYGLDTPEKMNSKYAESKTWSKYVNSYINSIKKG